MNSKSLVLGLVLGLIVGLPVGILTSKYIMPSSSVGTNNQVQVSGTVGRTQTGTIYFYNLNMTIQTSTLIVEGKYSILLVGGQSYGVDVNNYDPLYYDPDYTVYVQEGVTTFTANF